MRLKKIQLHVLPYTEMIKSYKKKGGMYLPPYHCLGVWQMETIEFFFSRETQVIMNSVLGADF